jgi:hypothetical protein
MSHPCRYAFLDVHQGIPEAGINLTPVNFTMLAVVHLLDAVTSDHRTHVIQPSLASSVLAHDDGSGRATNRHQIHHLMRTLDQPE